jgi:hypothetical protein
MGQADRAALAEVVRAVRRRFAEELELEQRPPRWSPWRWNARSAARGAGGRGPGCRALQAGARHRTRAGHVSGSKVDCLRAKTWMTPSIVRGDRLALADDDGVGCGASRSGNVL